MTHPLLIAAGLNSALRHKSKTLGSMLKRKGLYLGNGKKIGSGFKKDPEPEMTIMPVTRRALKFRS
jgi:hypothetical protein